MTDLIIDTLAIIGAALLSVAIVSRVARIWRGWVEPEVDPELLAMLVESDRMDAYYERMERERLEKWREMVAKDDAIRPDHIRVTQDEYRANRDRYLDLAREKTVVITDEDGNRRRTLGYAKAGDE